MINTDDVCDVACADGYESPVGLAAGGCGLGNWTSPTGSCSEWQWVWSQGHVQQALLLTQVLGCRPWVKIQGGLCGRQHLAAPAADQAGLSGHVMVSMLRRLMC